MTSFVTAGLRNDLRVFSCLNSRCRQPFSTSHSYRSHYETLGVPRTATPGQIKTSFYKLSQQYHPDRNRETGAMERFQKVSEAYAVLKDGRDRREYDRKLKQNDGSASRPGGRHPYASYEHSTEWSSQSRRHTRSSAEWAWSSHNSRTSSGGSAFKRPGTSQRNDPFSNPHVQRATGKSRSHETFSSSNPSSSSSGRWSDPYTQYRRKSTAETRAEQEHAQEAEANNRSGLWSTFPTIGITLVVLMLAHGWGAKA